MTATMAEPQFCETGTVVRMLGVSESTVRLWVRQGLVAPVRTVGGRYLFTHEQVEALRSQPAARRAAQLPQDAG